VEPDMEIHDRYEVYYQIYRSLYGTLQHTFHQLSDLAGQ
jgi:xylulokinase